MKRPITIIAQTEIDSDHWADMTDKEILAELNKAARLEESVYGLRMEVVDVLFDDVEDYQRWQDSLADQGGNPDPMQEQQP